MPNYKNGKIYKLISDETKEVYIGSTTKKYLCQRMASHRTHYKIWQEKGNVVPVTAFKILKFKDCKIVLIEDYPCKTKDELLSRERYWIEKTSTAVNKCIPGRTSKEYDKYYRNLPEVKKRKKEWDKNSVSYKLNSVH